MDEEIGNRVLEKALSTFNPAEMPKQNQLISKLCWLACEDQGQRTSNQKYEVAKRKNLLNLPPCRRDDSRKAKRPSEQTSKIAFRDATKREVDFW